MYINPNGEGVSGPLAISKYISYTFDLNNIG